MNAPITYLPSIAPAATCFADLWHELAWIRHYKVPRAEYFHNMKGTPYTYGTPPHERTYRSQPLTAALWELWFQTQKVTGIVFDVCFLNRYEDSNDHLGWHSDDSPEMDDDRPIAIVSLGAEREIWFRERPKDVMKDGDITWGQLFGKEEPKFERLLLRHGSLCLMAPGMQDTHQHRIPKCDRKCGPRISLTFRGLAA